MALIITLYCICGIYLLLNFKRDIHVFQQNSYRISRYWRWLRSGNLLPTWRIVDIALIFLLLTPFLWVSVIAVPITLIIKCVMIIKAKHKKPLVFTKRVWRLYGATGLLAAACYGACIAGAFICPGALEINAYFPNAKAAMLTPVCIALLISLFSWVFVMLGNVLMTPVEKLINRRYYRDAQRLLRSMPDMKIIGITGSYGKTSTKHYLHRILSEKYEVLMTPGSFNTPMGVIRTVREMLKPYHEIFICEMGAKQKGDIKEICDLVHPHYGIVTAVGPMHLETFKTIETVQATKFELTDALPANGLAIVNNDFEYCATRNVDNVECIRYAVTNTDEADYTVSDVEYTSEGTKFTINGPDGFLLHLHTKLIGDSNFSNLTAAVIMALRLGVSNDQIIQAVSRMEQVEHRLNVKRTPGGVTIIDDAYNSNPVGSRMAVEALGRFTGGRRIIVTPGMIELGSRQEELNKELGRHIAANVDVAVIVGRYNRQAILSGIQSAASLPEESIIIVDSFAESQTFLSSFLNKGDIVLYENDLPDTFK